MVLPPSLPRSCFGRSPVCVFGGLRKAVFHRFIYELIFYSNVIFYSNFHNFCPFGAMIYAFRPDLTRSWRESGLVFLPVGALLLTHDENLTRCNWIPRYDLVASSNESGFGSYVLFQFVDILFLKRLFRIKQIIELFDVSSKHQAPCNASEPNISSS